MASSARAPNVQRHHVADQVSPPAVQERRGHQSPGLVQRVRRQLCRNEPVSSDQQVSVGPERDLREPNDGVNADERPGDPGRVRNLPVEPSGINTGPSFRRPRRFLVGPWQGTTPGTDESSYRVIDRSA